jgi:hypothetical protein
MMSSTKVASSTGSFAEMVHEPLELATHGDRLQPAEMSGTPAFLRLSAAIEKRPLAVLHLPSTKLP